ncbi:MAG: LPS export ABC transporter periplasmic protein LptC [Gammaproteobacteria bacterium]
MDLQRSLTYLLLIFVLALTGWWWLDAMPEPEVPDTAERHAPDFWFDGMRLTNFDEYGLPENRVIAERMVHYRDDDTSEFTHIRFSSYSDTRPPMHVHGPTAWMDADGDVIQMYGANQVFRDAYDAQSWLQVDTRDMKILTNDDFVTSEHLTVIRSEDLVMRGVGMDAWLEEDRLQLHSEVRIRNEPDHPFLPADALRGTDAADDGERPEH